MANFFGRLFPLVQSLVVTSALLTTNVGAQTDPIPSSVDARLVAGSQPNELLIQIKANNTAPFGGVLSGLTMTIRYDAASGAALTGGASFCDAWSAFTPSPVVVNNGIAYRTYNGFGNNRLDDSEFNGGCNLTIPQNTWFTIRSVQVVGDACVEFILGDDAYTLAENRSYFMSMNGWDVTGEVEGSVMMGACDADCLGVMGGAAMPGTPCDDNNPNTEGDTWSPDCECIGTEVDDWDCADLQANIGDACDDGNANTENDEVTEDCECVGTVIWDCADLQANIGDACDDGNANTENDEVTEDCECVGTVIWDCVDLQANIGDACDDGNANTENDEVTEDCECVGTVVWDCADLQANIGDDCDDGNPVTINDVVTDTCECQGEFPDGIAAPEAGSTALGIYPNPTVAGMVTVHVEGLGASTGDALISILDASGKLVYQKEVVPFNGTIHQPIDLSGRLAQGVYTVRVMASTRSYTGRLVIQ